MSSANFPEVPRGRSIGLVGIGMAKVHGVLDLTNPQLDREGILGRGRQNRVYSAIGGLHTPPPLRMAYRLRSPSGPIASELPKFLLAGSKIKPCVHPRGMKVICSVTRSLQTPVQPEGHGRRVKITRLIFLSTSYQSFRPCGPPLQHARYQHARRD